MKKLLIASLSAALMIAPAAAGARNVAIAVSHAGLDLTNPSDIATMHERIEVAVEAACARLQDASDRSYCITDGKAKAKAELAERARLALVYTNAAAR